MRRCALQMLLVIGCATSCQPPQAACVQPPPGSTVLQPTRASANAAIAPEEASPVSFDAMAKFPEPGWQVPRAMHWAPDGKSVTYLMSEGGSDEMALFSFDLATRSSKVLLRAGDLVAPQAPTLTQELRDERQRKKIKGVTDYQWADRASVLIVPMGADLFAVQGATTTDLTTAEGEIVDPKICADGSKVALVRGDELAVIDVATKRETALTTKAPPGVTRGLSDFNGQEEFDEPSGHFWSPDCKTLAYLEVDERGVAKEPVLGHRGGTTNLMMQRYPRAGSANPLVSLRVVDVATRVSAAVPLPAGVAPGAYLGRFHFTPDSKRLVFWALDRSQRKRDLVVATLGPRPASRVAHSSQVEQGWLDMTDLRTSNGEVTTVLERDGHHHLARVGIESATSEPPSFLTSGGWDVLGIEGKHPVRGTVYVLATRDDAIGSMLYEVSAKGELTLRTPQKGSHAVVISSDGEKIVDLHSAIDVPPHADIHHDGGSFPVPFASDPAIAALAIRAPQLFELPTAGGVKLFGALLAPRVIDPAKRYPLVVVVYGGPGVQTVQDRWAPRLLWQHLADRGVYVMQVDNRGSSGRGPAFEQPIDRKLGEIELTDQRLAVDFISQRHPIDRARVGLYGHSYGGFMVLYAMLKQPGLFKAGVAGSPVSDWRLYDTGYTERYMGTPDHNAAGYDASDLEKYAANLSGDLLIVHSLMDENVHFQNSADIIDALVREKKSFEMFVFPSERHGYRSPAAKSHAMRTVTRFLTRSLDPAALDPAAEQH